jgi:hypothetical protein
MSKPSLTSEEARRKAEERFRRAKQREGEAHIAYEELAKRQQAELVVPFKLPSPATLLNSREIAHSRRIEMFESIH